MITRELNVLILGEVPEIGDIFDRPFFSDELPASPTHITDYEDFDAALEPEETYDLVLIDVTPHGAEILTQVRQHLPACPVIMIGNPEEAELILEAKRQGLEAFVMRGVDGKLFTDLLAEEIRTQLSRFVEPPKMDSPSADQMYRYAQFHNILEPFFVIARRRYLLYVNRAGQELNKTIHDSETWVGDDVEDFILEATIEEFNMRLDQAFSGREVVHERYFEPLDREFEDTGMRELHYLPVTGPNSRVLAVSVAISQPSRPQLQRARTMHQMTGLAAAISHENNNLLNVLMSNADILADRITTLGDKEASKRLKKIDAAITRATRFTHQLQAFSQTSVSQPVAVDFSELIEEQLISLRVGLSSKVKLVEDLEMNLPAIWADRHHLETVVTNLVRNSARSMSDGGILHLKTRSLEVTPVKTNLPVTTGDYVVLEVTSTGREFADSMRERLFDPFITTHRTQRKSELELATVKSIIEQIGGLITVDQSDDETMVRAYLPATREVTEDDEKDQYLARERSTILLVEDEEFLREAYIEIFSTHGYKILSAAPPAEARKLFEDHENPIDLLLTDITFREGSGVDLAWDLVDENPQLHIVFISGHPPQHLAKFDKNGSSHIFLRKPVPIPTLLKTIEEILQKGTG